MNTAHQATDGLILPAELVELAIQLADELDALKQNITGMTLPLLTAGQERSLKAHAGALLPALTAAHIAVQSIRDAYAGGESQTFPTCS